jgi:hypothetical protein
LLTAASFGSKSSRGRLKVSDDSIWRTWKPYAAIIAVVAAAIWWYTSQSSFAKLKDGDYNCRAVFVNESGKYQVLVDESGTPYPAISAEIRDGRLAGMSGDSPMPADQLSSLTVRKSGSSHFHVTDDPAMHSYNAVACDYAG